MSVYDLAPRFAALFDGLKQAHGTGAGRWVKRPLRPEDWVKHLQGVGDGIGVAPLREDNTVAFAAIDLDEPDFDAAREMQRYIPGPSFVEVSRSGNAHVWVFFKPACPAWLAMAVLKEAVLAAGKQGVEVFPKNHDFAKVKLGNYINLPYFGGTRHMTETVGSETVTWGLDEFVGKAEETANDPAKWRARADIMQISPPSERKDAAEFGTQTHLHSCAERIISGEAGPIVDGTRNAVLFMLSKNLLNWQQVNREEALDILASVNNDLFDPPAPMAEVTRIFANVERSQFTSTGCDDPLCIQYSDPSCTIAHPRS